MAVDITSVPVLETMYNNTNRIEKDRGLFCLLFFQSRQGGQQSIRIMSSNFMFIVGKKEAGLVTVNQ